MRTYGEETMDDPISPARRTLLKAGAATLATPVAAAIAQPAAAVGHQEAKSFDLWVISDQHVRTDKAASEGIQHGMVGFRPPPVRAESLAAAPSAGCPSTGISRSISATMRASGMRPRTS